MKSRFPYTRCSGFSLVEVTIAMAIASVAVISIIGLIPAATKGSAESAEQTAIGTMFEDLENRIGNQILEPGPVRDENGDPFYYDLRGNYISPGNGRVPSSIVTDRFFRAEVELVEPGPGYAKSSNLGGALAVRVEIFWPLDDQGEAIHPLKPGGEITFFAGARTGPGWTDVDANFQPKIEY
ncbi:MAG: prepilin-type N-terminal cleavage/methylation domain-containing protein [Verrucomicrobiales bacterium]|nr:prepilin-type N-terminal cleavage/methylation domain-containing protein [Verrucomicrobiales bacterium]